ncbi:hypothetical protein [Methanocella sp. MCL-LM]|uniref:hypothetical protein n=1 Tax=Methanocella sp. MCL-LM TaxID=3412035 RepID=UPI003C70C18F
MNRFFRSFTMGLTVALVMLVISLPGAVADKAPVETYPVTFDGYVCYSDGTTPASGVMVNVYYPSDATTPTYSTTTDALGYYRTGGAFTGKADYWVGASMSTVSETILYVSGTVMNTGSDQVLTNSFNLLESPPATPTPTPAPTFSMRGRVLYEGNSTPVSGATVYVAYDTNRFTATTDTSGDYSLGSMPYTGEPVTVWASLDMLTSREHTPTPVAGENLQDLVMRLASPSSSPSPSPGSHRNPAFYVFTSMDGANVNDVEVTCQFNGATYSGISHYMDIEDAAIMLSYHGPGVLYLEVPQGYTGSATFRTKKGDYEGYHVAEVPYPYDCISSFTVPLTQRTATPTSPAVPAGNVSSTPTPAPGVSPTPVAGTNSTEILGGTISTGTNTTATPSPASSATPQAQAGLPGGLAVYAGIGLGGLILVLVLIALAYLLLRKK